MKYQLRLLHYSLLILVIASSTHLKAQQKENIYGPDEDAKALQFQIAENFRLTSFNGSTISYINHVSKKRAHRIGLSISNRYRHQDQPEVEDADVYSTRLDSDLRASFTWKNYTDPEALIKFYYGFGPGITVGYDRLKSKSTTRKNRDNMYTIALSGLAYAGAEWFFHPSISLHAEYGASVMGGYSRREANTEQLDSGEKDKEVRNVKEIQFGGSGVRFGISVYF